MRQSCQHGETEVISQPLDIVSITSVDTLPWVTSVSEKKSPNLEHLNDMARHEAEMEVDLAEAMGVFYSYYHDQTTFDDY